jgi:hypothetical protein
LSCRDCNGSEIAYNVEANYSDLDPAEHLLKMHKLVFSFSWCLPHKVIMNLRRKIYGKFIEYLHSI